MNEENNKPIGIFDSGLGGLCALTELQKLLPNEHFVYFGDTGRTPYGTRSAEKIIEYARSDIDFLLSKQVKAIVCACGTVSSVALPSIESSCTVPICGTIYPSCAEATEVTENKLIGVMGTGATIASGAFEKAVAAYGGGFGTVCAACPLLVPIVENGFADSEIAVLALREYMEPIVNCGADTVILGCTHFPILSKTIRRLYPSLKLVDSGAASARQMYRILKENCLLNDSGDGKTEYYVTDTPNNFATAASVFLGRSDFDVKKTEIEDHRHELR